MSAKADVDAIRESILRDLARVKQHVQGDKVVDPGLADLDDAWTGIETFVAVALRVFAKTNPSKIRSEALTAAVHAKLIGAQNQEEL
jgi:hypothetical protein